MQGTTIDTLPPRDDNRYPTSTSWTFVNRTHTRLAEWISLSHLGVYSHIYSVEFESICETLQSTISTNVKVRQQVSQIHYIGTKNDGCSMNVLHRPVALCCMGNHVHYSSEFEATAHMAVIHRTGCTLEVQALIDFVSISRNSKCIKNNWCAGQHLPQFASLELRDENMYYLTK